MSKRELIDGIRQHNRSAAPKFLAQFDEEALKQYLDHLEAAKKKHVTLARFVRTPRGREAAAA